EDGTTIVVSRQSSGRRKPQWSPSTEDGTTRPSAGLPTTWWPAAMEPVHGGRDDQCPAHRERVPHQAAMEPVHGGRDDRRCGFVAVLDKTPQWSPSTEDGTTAAVRRSGAYRLR